MSIKTKNIRFVIAMRGFRSLDYSKPYLHFYERIIDRVIANSQRIGTLFVGIFYSFSIVIRNTFSNGVTFDKYSKVV